MADTNNTDDKQAVTDTSTADSTSETAAQSKQADAVQQQAKRGETQDEAPTDVDENILETIPAGQTQASTDDGFSKKHIGALVLLALLGSGVAGLVWLNKQQAINDNTSTENTVQTQPQNENQKANSDTNTQSHRTHKPAQNPAQTAKQTNDNSQPKQIRLGKLLLNRPPAGDGLVLTETQIGWCLYQKLRIDTLRSSLKQDTAMVQLNQQTQNYNNRCGHYKYSQGAMSIAQNDLSAHHKNIIADAKKEAKQLDEAYENQPNIATVPTGADAPKVSLPKVATGHTAAKKLLPKNECALVVTVVSTALEANTYVQEHIIDRKYVKILQMTGGSYAVSVGTLTPSETSTLVPQWKQAGIIPQSSVCYPEAAFLRAVPLATTNHLQAKKPPQAARPQAARTVTPEPKIIPKNPYTANHQQHNTNAGMPPPAPPSANARSNNHVANEQAGNYPPAQPYQDDGTASGYFAAGSQSKVDSNKNLREIENLMGKQSSRSEQSGVAYVGTNQQVLNDASRAQQASKANNQASKPTASMSLSDGDPILDRAESHKPNHEPKP